MTIPADAPALAADMPHEARITSPAMVAMAALLDELVAAGLEHIVVCPGSRSQALALVAAELERDGRVRLHVRVDERSAGFLALGIGRESGRPAAVIVTSGTAVGNLMPAVMEAHHGGVPLLLLTADRPEELRGIGANQATSQPALFSSFVRFEVDADVPVDESADAAFRTLARTAWDAASGAPAGPAHLNLPVREPLAGNLPSWWPSSGAVEDTTRVRSSRAPHDPRPLGWNVKAHTVLVAGADAGPAAAALAADRGWPLLAEIVSGSRVDATAVADYRAALRDAELAAEIERVVVIGHPTLSREVSRLLSRADLDIVAVPATGEHLDLNGSTRPTTWEQLREAPRGDEAWARRWDRPHPAAEAGSDSLTRADLVRTVWQASTPADRLLFGSSRLVRVADDVLAARPVRVHANRGLAGIDGTVATAIGIDAAAHDGVTRVVLGDLTLLHDAGSLLVPIEEPDPRVQLIVGNDGGGTIFDTLEVAAAAGPAAFQRVQYTPQHVDLASLVRAYGWEHVRVTDVAALAAALEPARIRRIIEVPLPR